MRINSIYGYGFSQQNQQKSQSPIQQSQPSQSFGIFRTPDVEPILRRMYEAEKNDFMKKLMQHGIVGDVITWLKNHPAVDLFTENGIVKTKAVDDVVQTYPEWKLYFAFKSLALTEIKNMNDLKALLGQLKRADELKRIYSDPKLKAEYEAKEAAEEAARIARANECTYVEDNRDSLQRLLDTGAKVW